MSILIVPGKAPLGGLAVVGFSLLGQVGHSVE
jgi:hypothetical protein